MHWLHCASRIWLAAGMFLVHYAWRSFAYPLLSRGGNRTPVLIWLLALAFCLYNGLLQARARPPMNYVAQPELSHTSTDAHCV